MQVEVVIQIPPRQLQRQRRPLPPSIELLSPQTRVRLSRIPISHFPGVKAITAATTWLPLRQATSLPPCPGVTISAPTSMEVRWPGQIRQLPYPGIYLHLALAPSHLLSLEAIPAMFLILRSHSPPNKANRSTQPPRSRCYPSSPPILTRPSSFRHYL